MAPELKKTDEQWRQELSASVTGCYARLAPSPRSPANTGTITRMRYRCAGKA